jgi:transcriptional regulator with PAS, ATPase and Fis domain
VLITGESGSGKEVLADLIHGWSARAGKPLIKVNCAAIPENLLESELFGHEKGAFTGAFQSRIGHFEEGSEGTVFLDEIGEMSPALQAKLLHVTQDGRFRRVGSNLDRRSGARVIGATNIDLEQRMREGKFREDLFYRLNVVELRVPPLRERLEDILPLAILFLSRLGGGKTRLSAGAAACLQSFAWPGNVRELRNAMERAALLSRGEVILPEHLPSRIPRVAGPAQPLSDATRLEDVEREAILQALKEHRFNRTDTARSLAISRRSLVYKLQRLRELGFQVDPP